MPRPVEDQVLHFYPFSCHLLPFSELKGEEGWRQFNYSKTFSLSKETVHDNCPRISYTEFDQRTFAERYERPSQPVVIVDGQRNWPAVDKWTLEVCALLINGCGHVKLILGGCGFNDLFLEVKS